jgi:hypothetical protein
MYCINTLTINSEFNKKGSGYNSIMTTIYDVIFVGAGPASLAGAYYLHKNKPDVNFLLIEMGKNVTRRDRNSPVDCVTSIFGAGGFSDGKFSFFPSSTGIWKLDKTKLRSSYKFMKDFMNEYSGDIPDFPEELGDDFVSKEDWTLKSYKSIYLNLEQRIKLAIKISIDYYDPPNNRFKLFTEVIDIRKEDDIYVCVCKNINTGEISEIRANKLVLGGGRFMPNLMKKIPFIPMIFRRVELGARFEGSSDSPLYNISTNIDPKFMKWDQQNKIEYRIFCSCKDGETTLTNFKGIETWSGRSDCEPTGKSNFGFNLRFKDPKYIPLLDRAFEIKPFIIDIDLIKKNGQNVEDELRKYYGEFADYYLTGLKSFLEFASIDSLNGFTIKGPCIEGVGEYPLNDDNLKVPGENIFVIGDCGGRWRGIISSFLSGIFVAHDL